MTRLIFAPNWIGDAVMALPAIADVRRHDSAARLLVAARPGVADVMALAPGVDGVIRLSGDTAWGGIRSLARDSASVRAAGAEMAILLPNSARVALLARQAGVPERCGYRTDVRRILLTRAVRKPRGVVHQVDYYRHLVAELGMVNGSREPGLCASDNGLSAARALLRRSGWDGLRPLVGFGPGAAYGGAKRWPPDRFADVMQTLVTRMGDSCVIVGSVADGQTSSAIQIALRRAAALTPGSVIDLVGQTDVSTLCGVLALTRAFVSNDSGAMHLAAALGVPVVAVFGPTDDRTTSPVGSRPATLLTARAWCRPCLLRECPLDHRCMTGVNAIDVVNAVDALGAVKE